MRTKAVKRVSASNGSHPNDPKSKFRSYLKVMLAGKNDLCGILVLGHTGIGKTHFVESQLARYASTYPVLIARHRQQHTNIPYYGLKQAISDFLTQKYHELSALEFEKLATHLKNYYGESFSLFLEFIPEISLIIKEDYEVSQKYVPKVKNQLFVLFKTFFSFLHHYYRRPVFFFTDDLQWTDTSGMGLLKYLLLELTPEKLTWIASCRENPSQVYSHFHLIEQLGFDKKRVETIYLKSFTRGDVKRIMASKLGAPVHPELAQTCFELCNGHPSYLPVLVESLKNTEHIWLLEGVWYCDVQAIREYYEGQGKEKILFDRLVHLSEPARLMLYIMACTGGYHQKVLTNWWARENMDLGHPLREAEEKGFLKKQNSSFIFSERYVGEMIYENLPHDERTEIHYKIAKLLYQQGLDNLSAVETVLMTTQFNQSLSTVRRLGEQTLCAELNYVAGKQSRKDNALSQAQYFFKMSADLLKECPWEQVSEKIYAVYMERAWVEYQLGIYDLAEIHLDYILERITDVFKRVDIYELKVIINNHLGRFRKAVHILKECLAELDVELPLDETILLREIEELKTVLEDEERDTHPTTVTKTDLQKQSSVLKLLYIGGMSLHHTSDVLMKWAALMIITRSRVCPTIEERAIGYVSYARMLIIDGAIDKGYDLGKKGLEINNSLQGIRLRCRVYGVFAFYLQPWKKAFADSFPLLDMGIEAGEKSGDLIGSYILKTHKLNLHLLSGLPLKELESIEFGERHPSMEMTYYITLYQVNFARFLTEETPFFSMSEQQPSRLAAKFTVKEESFYRNYVWARYYLLFGNYELAANAAARANDNKKLQEGSPLLPANLMVWSLAITQNWFNYKPKRRTELAECLQDIMDRFELWSHHAPGNYASPWWLLKAEFQRISGEKGDAAQYYTQAIDMARDNLYYKAVSCEFFAIYLLSVDDQPRAARYFRKAITCYQQWGATAKVKQLRQQYRAIIEDEDPHKGDMTIEMIQHEFSGDMDVHSLVNKLMVLLLRISGSTRVVIESSMDDENLSRLGSFSLPCNTDLHASNIIPISLILLAHRSQDQILVNDLQSPHNLGDLSAFSDRGVKALLIQPVTIRNLSMVIYLENCFTSSCFTSGMLRWILVTANQGGVIIENARIHELTVKLNDHLREEMEEKERLTGLVKSQRDDHLHALVQAQDDERKRIASDLHDSLGSLLSTVRVRFNQLQEELAADLPEKKGQVETTLNLLDEAVDELRRIAHNMLPVTLHKFGLEAALKTFIENIQLPHSLEVSVQILGLRTRLPEQTEVSLYRICQELVQNVLKHAKASQMRLQLIDHGDALNLIVEDDGVGMDTSAIVYGFGFHTIETKVDLLNGTFSIESRPGAGTMVLINIPVLSA